MATGPSNLTVRRRSYRRSDTSVERLFGEVSHAACYSCFALAMKGGFSQQIYWSKEQIRPEIDAASEWLSRKGDDIPDAWRSAIQYYLSKSLYGPPFEERVLKIFRWEFLDNVVRLLYDYAETSSANYLSVG